MRNNFLAIVLCLMMGTAGLPHILMRSFTTPSVDTARKSVFWPLFFILLLYLTGLCVTVVYMIQAQPRLLHWLLGIPTSEPVSLWWDIQPIAAGVFGAPAAFAVIVLVSLLTRRINPVTDALVDNLSLPD